MWFCLPLSEVSNMKVFFGFVILLVFAIGIGFGIKSIVVKITSIVRASREHEKIEKSTDDKKSDIASPSSETPVKEVDADECDSNRDS